MTKTSAWSPLETLNTCWLLFCCLRAAQSVKTLSDIKAMSVHCGRRGACWLRTVIILWECSRVVAVLCQASACVLWGQPIHPFCVCTPWEFLLISQSIWLCLCEQIGLKVIWHWGWTRGFQWAMQVLSDSLGLALYVQEEMTISEVYFNIFFPPFCSALFKVCCSLEGNQLVIMLSSQFVVCRSKG